MRRKFTCWRQNLTFSAAKFRQCLQTSLFNLNNLLKISKLSLSRIIRLKCNKSNICKSVEFILFRYERELSLTQAIHMILLLFCFVDFNCLAAAAALENYNPLKIVNGYHRIYTYSRAVCPNCHNRRKIKNHLTRLNVCGIVMAFVAMVKIPCGVSKTSQSINYYETSTKNKWHVPEQLEILEYVCLCLTLHSYSTSLALPHFLKTTTTTTRSQRAAQQKRM